MKIGFFDSGLGGATILAKAYKEIDAEFIYLADTKNAPYGLKKMEEVKELTENNIKKLINLNCKIIVIACNTATSAAIEDLRKKYNEIKFIGTEPAVKPALQECKNKKIIVTATSLTLKGKKFLNLVDKFEAKEKIETIPLDKLVEYADKYKTIEYNLAKKYLNKKFAKLESERYSGIVLGCTHFPIFKNEMRQILPKDIKIYDSASGVTNNLKMKIEGCNENENTNRKINLILTKEVEGFEEKFNLIINKKGE